jgi:general L-amino acid transport system permease protein
MADAPSQLNQEIPNRSFVPALLRDQRILSIVGQLIFAFVLVYLISLLWTSILSSLNSKNLTPNLNFFSNRAGFDIGERPDWYSSNSSYGDAFKVGLTNSLRIISVGLVLTTVIGVLGGIFLLSSNWLLRNVTRGAVELLRNTPILIQLIFWYAIVIASLPDFRSPMTLLPEGRYMLPIRWVVEVAVVLFLWFGYLAKEKVGSPRRMLAVSALLGAVVAIEAGFLFVGASFGSGVLTSTGFIVYAVLSVILIGISATQIHNLMRWRALGLSIGQFVGGLLFYFGILPGNGIPVDIYPTMFISRRGFAFPEFHTTARFAEWLAFIGIGVSLALVMWIYLGRVTEQTGRAYPRPLYAVLAIGVFTIIGWFAVGVQPAPSAVPVTKDGQTVFMSLSDARDQGLLTPDDEQYYSTSPLLYIPPVQRVNAAGVVSGFVSGTQLSPEYIALLLGLVIYTAAFIAEIVRAGILAVPKGQIEASRALGFTTTQTLWMIILPQAMRVIIPPLASQYLNLAKNSSLAIAIAFADVVQITTTIMNQSGQSVSGITLIMITYLTISLIIAFFTNLANRRFQLVTR